MGKLVRDRIPEIIRKSEKVEPQIRILSNKEEFKAALMEKLHEEIGEFVESQSIEELADVQEVLFALADTTITRSVLLKEVALAETTDHHHVRHSFTELIHHLEEAYERFHRMQDFQKLVVMQGIVFQFAEQMNGRTVLERERQRKEIDRGAFKQRIYLESVPTRNTPAAPTLGDAERAEREHEIENVQPGSESSSPDQSAH